MFRILITILKRKKYLIAAVVSSILMASISYYLMVVNVYQKSIFVYADMNGTLYTITSLILGLIIAILFGFYLSLLIFRHDIVQAKATGNKATGLTGAAIGIVASGCPSCGVPLLGLIGFPLALYSLPFKGLELKILSIIFLFLGIFLIAKNIKKNLFGCCPII